MAPMPPAWLAVEDEESGAMYFYHERTGRTTWEHPADRCALHPLAQHVRQPVDEFSVGSSRRGAALRHTACFREGLFPFG